MDRVEVGDIVNGHIWTGDRFVTMPGAASSSSRASFVERYAGWWWVTAASTVAFFVGLLHIDFWLLKPQRLIDQFAAVGFGVTGSGADFGLAVGVGLLFGTVIQVLVGLVIASVLNLLVASVVRRGGLAFNTNGAMAALALPIFTVGMSLAFILSRASAI